MEACCLPLLSRLLAQRPFVCALFWPYCRSCSYIYVCVSWIWRNIRRNSKVQDCGAFLKAAKLCVAVVAQCILRCFCAARLTRSIKVCVGRIYAYRHLPCSPHASHVPPRMPPGLMLFVLI